MAESALELWQTYGWPLTLMVVQSLVLLVVLLIFVAYLLLLDRKVWAAVQLRRGPNVVGAFELLDAAWTIPAAAVLGLIALLFARRARRQLRFTLVRGRHAAARAGRTLGVVALCLAVTASISYGFYRLLVEFQ